MLRKLYLEGDMGEKYGRIAEVKATTVREVIQYLDANHSGIKEYLLDKQDKNIGFTIKIADEYVEDDRELLLPLDKGDIVITPVPVGSKGIFKVILGIALIIFAFVSQQPWVGEYGKYLIAAGLGLAASGIAELMAPDPATDNTEENKEGYLFQGAEQSIPEGRPVPVLYGELRVPGQPVTFNLRNSSEGFLSGASNAGTMTTIADSEGNLFLVPAPVVEE